MVERKIRTDFKAMNVAELKNYLQEQGISASRYLKTSSLEITFTVEKDDVTSSDKPISHQFPFHLSLRL